MHTQREYSRERPGGFSRSPGARMFYVCACVRVCVRVCVLAGTILCFGEGIEKGADGAVGRSDGGEVGTVMRVCFMCVCQVGRACPPVPGVSSVRPPRYKRNSLSERAQRRDVSAATREAEGEM